MSLPRHRLLRAAVPAALVAALALAAPSADAKTLRHSDKVQDVMKYDENADTQAADPGHANGDVVRTKMWHSAHRIGIRVQFSELKRSGSMRADILRIVTNEGVKRYAYVTAGPKGTTRHAWRGDAELDRASGRRVSCSVSHSIDYDANVVQIGVPRSCLSSPRWVRLGYGAMSVSLDGNTSWADDSQLDGAIKDDVALCMRIYRG
jgi:hypothetical protein